MKRLIHGLVVGLAVLAFAGKLQAATYEQILRWVPADSNVLIVVDLDRAMGTSLAKRTFWQQVLQVKSPDGQAFVKPQFQKLVMATFFQPGQDEERSEVMLIASDSMPSDDVIAQRQGAAVEQMGDKTAMLSPRGMYLVRLADDLLGVITPPQRQRAMRWMQEGGARSQHALSPALTQAIERCRGTNAVMFLAMDLEGALSTVQVARALRDSEAMKDQLVDINTASQVIAGIRSIALRVEAEEDILGVLEVTFTDDATLLEPVAGALVREALEKQGLALDDLSSWQSQVVGNRITMTGPLSESGLGRLLSMMTPPRPDVRAEAPDTADAPEADAKPTDPAQVSLAYYRTVMAYVEDLRSMSNPLASASYLVKYARKIEQTPIMGVDPQLLAWSEQVVLSLTDAANKIRNAELEGRRKAAENVGVVDANAPAPALQDSGNYGYDNYDDYDDDDDDSISERKQARRRMDYDLHWQREQRATERTKAKLDAKAAGKQAAIDTLSGLQAKTVEVRRAMTQKYGVEF